MAKLTRVTGKVFGGSAPLNEIGQFGSALAGNPTNTQDVATIQALDAYSKGWGSAVITSRQFPPIEEVTGVLKTISYQACYMLQEGIPAYDVNTEYSNTSVVKYVNNGNVTLYLSLIDNNIGNPVTDTSSWQPLLNTSVYADTSLSNLDATGEAHFADPSLSNLNVTGNSKIVNACAPDWANAVEKSINTTYTAKSNGYFITSGYAAGRNFSMIIYVNSVERMWVGFHGGGGSSYTIPLVCPISKGDTYSVSWANSAYFLPIKGV